MPLVIISGMYDRFDYGNERYRIREGFKGLATWLQLPPAAFLDTVAAMPLTDVRAQKAMEHARSTAQHSIEPGSSQDKEFQHLMARWEKLAEKAKATSAQKRSEAQQSRLQRLANVKRNPSNDSFAR